MGRRQIEIKYLENSISRKVTFSRRRDGIFKKADALAKLCNVEVAVLVISPTNLPYTYGNPSFIDVVERIQNPSASSILKNQAKLDRLMKELERIKVHEEVLRKRQQKNLETFNMKKIVGLKLEDLIAFKEKLEAFQADLNMKHVEMAALSSPLMLSKNTKKKKLGIEFSSRESFLSNRKIYEIRSRTPQNYLE